jgi:hypothetical protein
VSEGTRTPDRLDHNLSDGVSLVPRRFSDLQGDDPMILTLARGHYCPKEHQQHLELAAHYPKINVAYTRIATIATDEHHTLQEFLKPGLVIHRIYNGYWFWGRPSIVDLWHDLRDVESETLPDWDLSAPGLREAWDAGDLSPFHGWNKRGAARPSAASSQSRARAESREDRPGSSLGVA